MTTNSQYLSLKLKHQQEFNEFPMVFAFDKKQLADGLVKLGLTPEDTDKVYSFSDTGGFYRRTDSARLHEMFDRHHAERQAALDGDATGDGYIFDMFYFELDAREYNYTEDLTDTLEYLGLTLEEIEADKRLGHGLNKAIKELHRREVAWI